MDEKIALEELAELVEFEGGLVGLFENDKDWSFRLEHLVGSDIWVDLMEAEAAFRKFERFARRVHDALPTLEDEVV